MLNVALSTGGDYAEIYLEETTPESYVLENGRVDSVSASQSYGCGLRILNGFRSVYGYTSDLSAKSLIGLAESLRASFEGERKITVSVGATFYTDTLSDTFEEIYRRADEGTYESKRHGKNHVSFTPRL